MYHIPVQEYDTFNDLLFIALITKKEYLQGGELVFLENTRLGKII
ncbi:hypothetical protein JCM17380_51650 [Desulfosporosinus burensis]